MTNQIKEGDPTAVMMFAAGFGTRMKHLTKDQPKPMIKVAGQPLIDHALTLARAATDLPIVANLHYKPERLKRHLETEGVQTILETPDILETGGGLRHALPLLGTGPVFTMNTDAIWSGPNPLKLLQTAWRPEAMDALLICIPPQNAAGYTGAGDFVLDKTGRLSRGPGMVYGGIQIFKTHLLHEVREKAFSLNIVWSKMQTQGRLYGLEYGGKWCDVGHPGGITLAEDLLRDAHV